MNLTECQQQIKYLVTKVNAKGSLKQRLVSFGFMKGAIIEYISSTNLKKTYKIKVDKMYIALRREEAETIDIKVIE